MNYFLRFNLKVLAALSFLIVISYGTLAQESIGYQKPPQEFIDLIENSGNRNIVISGRGNYMAILADSGYPSIQEVAQPFLSLAGLRVHTGIFGNARSSYYSSIKIKHIDSNSEFNLNNLPKDPKIKNVIFSPDEKYVTFSLTFEKEIQLWIADLETRSAKRMMETALNDVSGRLYQWSPDSRSLIVKCVAIQKDPPLRSNVPTGPNVQENLGKKSAVRTYQDLLKNKNDEELLTYYLTSQLKTVYLNGETVNFGLPNTYRDFDFSPNGALVMTEVIQKPYSFIVPISSFSYDVLLNDKYGKPLEKIATVPLADQLPQGFDAVVQGPRNFGWRADKPQTYYWVVAQDGGDPSKPQSIKDIVYTREYTGQFSPNKQLAVCYYRFNKIDWGNDQIAIITERWWKTRAERRVFIKPAEASYRVNLWDRYYEDNYSNPGSFVTVKNDYDKDVLLLAQNIVNRAADVNNMHIFTISEGASPIGNRPFLLKFNVKTKLTDTLFRSKAPFYEKPIFFDNRGKFIFSRESVTEPTNYFSLIKDKKFNQLTYFSNPYPQLSGVIKQQLKYTRKDGIKLTANLYLPKDYSIAKGKIPVLMWAYPREFKTISAASEVKGSPYQFTKLSWSSPVFWVTQGYAVMDNVDMPIVGESNDLPNDTFIEQLRLNAEAAIDKITTMGIGDKEKIAVGGHSYGAFMTANLLAHTKLFAAGIARSGAYNRTLTPFGFQSEERSYWDAPELYFKMSPFSYANRIKSPLLLIHGEADDNSGTFPVQSERLYSALKGFGATTRLVYLPSEAHSYRAKESVLHMLWEMNNWLDKHVKNKTYKPL